MKMKLIWKTEEKKIERKDEIKLHESTCLWNWMQALHESFLLSSFYSSKDVLRSKKWTFADISSLRNNNPWWEEEPVSSSTSPLGPMIERHSITTRKSERKRQGI